MQNPKQEVTLEKIDFEWVAEQTKPQQLKKALKLLELDGNYYTELIRACEDQLAKIDPKFKKGDPTVVDPQLKEEAKTEVEEWVDQPKLQKNQKLAEIERTKGNEAIKSNDLQEALNYYTKSIQYDDRMAASYCNRALVYLKLKNYESVVKDCNQAIQLQSDYLKAYHRRGKAYFAQQQYDKAYLDFKYIIEKEPTNDEVNGELRECRKHLTDQQINTAQNKQFIEKAGGFKKVQIVEEDDDDDDEEEDKIPISKQKQRLDFSKQIQKFQTKKKISELIKRGQYSMAIEQISILEEELINVRASLLMVEYCTVLIEVQPPRGISKSLSKKSFSIRKN